MVDSFRWTSRLVGLGPVFAVFLWHLAKTLFERVCIMFLVLAASLWWRWIRSVRSFLRLEVYFGFSIGIKFSKLRVANCSFAAKLMVWWEPHSHYHDANLEGSKPAIHTGLEKIRPRISEVLPCPNLTCPVTGMAFTRRFTRVESKVFE